jgi:hypothetical protein
MLTRSSIPAERHQRHGTFAPMRAIVQISAGVSKASEEAFCAILPLIVAIVATETMPTGTGAMVVHGMSHDVGRRAGFGNRHLAALPGVPCGVPV